MSRRVTVHHFVANTTTTQSGLHPTSNLLGVDYWHDVPADTEFPRRIGRMDLFTRFYIRKAKPVEFFVRVLWLDTPTGTPRIIGRYGPELVSFRPDETVRDHVFKVIHLQLEGTGRHRILLLRERPDAWGGKRFAVVTETHFFVRR
jgi:hypothetical protein